MQRAVFVSVVDLLFTNLLDLPEALFHDEPCLPFDMSSLHGVEVHLSKALLHQHLLEVASHMLYPLFLPVGEDLHCSVDAALL